jgi:SAM-dependent methyltransferase
MLRCPQTGQALVRDGDSLRTADGALTWPLLAGRPVLRAGAEPPQVMDPAHISHGLPGRALALIHKAAGPVLHLSAGGTPQAFDNVVELEFAVFRHTDVVADAHALPFADESFEAVLSMNAFEHYHDPARVAGEVLRVLKPGGQILVHTAFLQPLHEAPHHFYNATRHGVAHWFAAFETVDLSVSDNFNPMNALAWIAAEAEQILAEGVGEAAAERFAAMTLGELAALWRSPQRREDEVWRSFLAAPQDALARIAAGFEFLGRKPG